MLNGGLDTKTNSAWAPAPLRPSESRPLFLYFLEAPGRIKIGVSRDVDARQRAIQLHLEKPLTRIGTIESTYPAEKALHRHLAAYRIEGTEWFVDCAPVRDVIDTILRDGFDATGIEVIEVEKPPLPTQDPNRPHPMPAMIRLMWPDDALAELQALSNQPESVVREWMEDGRKIPRLVRLALATALHMWVFGNPMSFREGRPNYLG